MLEFLKFYKIEKKKKLLKKKMMNMILIFPLIHASLRITINTLIVMIS